MRRRSSTRLGALALAGGLAAAAAMGATASSAVAVPNEGADGQKVEICHATGSDTNPFIQESVSVESIFRTNGHDQHQDGRDVIPPFEYTIGGVTNHYAGRNWGTNDPGRVGAPCFGMGIEKTGDATAIGGSTITYSIAVTNTGALPIPFGSIEVTDPSAATVTPPDDTTALRPGDTRNWGATRTADLTFCGTALVNVANVNFAGNEKDIQSSEWSTSISCPVGLRISKTGDATVGPGGTINYTLTVTNTGSLPVPYADIVVADKGADITEPTNKGALAPGASRAWTATKQAPTTDEACGQVVPNTASVSVGGTVPGYTEPENALGDNSSEWNTTVICTPPSPPEQPVTPAGVVATPESPTAFRPSVGVLTLRKSGPKTALGGGRVSWTLKVTNTGAADLTGVVLSDPVPRTMVLGALPDGATRTGARITWDIGTLPAGQSVTRELPVTLARTLRGKACNTATVRAEGTGSVISRACTTVTVARRPATPVTG